MTVADAPFDLAEAKLAAPRTRPGSVPKTGVIARLRASQQPFATVIAPAGYGKTTLLARWAEMDPRPFAWVALDGQDDDGIVFLRYIAAAIHRVEPVAPAVFDALGGPGASIWSMAVPRVGSALATLQRPLVLVLDDLHAVRNRSCLDVLAALHEYVPPGSQIAVASREEPALPLARWRTRGWLHEVGVADLRLDEREAGVLLQGAGVELDPAGVADLTGRTEGWPAGLYLAALSLQAGSPGPARAETFTGEDRFVSEYFRYELLSRLPEAEARFLLHTSVLDSMCGGLCDAVVQTTRSASTLAETRALQRFRGAAGPAGRVVPLPPPVRPAAAQRARAERPRGSGGALSPRDDLVHGQRPGRGGGPVRTRRGREIHGRRADRRAGPAAVLRRADGDRGGMAELVRRPGPGAVPRPGRVRRLVPGDDRAASRGCPVARAIARHRMKEGEQVYCALSWSEHPAPQNFDEAYDRLVWTAHHWQHWLDRGELP